MAVTKLSLFYSERNFYKVTANTVDNTAAVPNRYKIQFVILLFNLALHCWSVRIMFPYLHAESGQESSLTVSTCQRDNGRRMSRAVNRGAWERVELGSFPRGTTDMQTNSNGQHSFPSLMNDRSLGRGS